MGLPSGGLDEQGEPRRLVRACYMQALPGVIPHTSTRPMALPHAPRLYPGADNSKEGHPGLGTNPRGRAKHGCRELTRSAQAKPTNVGGKAAERDVIPQQRRNRRLTHLGVTLCRVGPERGMQPLHCGHRTPAAARGQSRVGARRDPPTPSRAARPSPREPGKCVLFVWGGGHCGLWPPCPTPGVCREEQHGGRCRLGPALIPWWPTGPARGWTPRGMSGTNRSGTMAQRGGQRTAPPP